MFCKSCGAEMPEGTKFCTKCGTPMAQKTKLGTIIEERMQEPMPAEVAQEVQGTATPNSIPQPPIPQQPEPQAAAQPKPVLSGAAESQSASKKSGSPVSFITLGLAALALALAIVGLVLPNMNKQPEPTNAPKVVAANTTTVTIKAGETQGVAKIFDPNTPVIVMGTSSGGDDTFSDVMYDPARGEIYILAKKAVQKETKRDIMWVAYEK